LLQGIADQQGERDAAVIQDQALETLVDRLVLRQQLISERLEFRPQGQRPLQVGQAQRVFLDADEMQARTGQSVLLEQLPGAEKIQPGAEAGFANHQSPAHRQRGKTFTQSVLFEEHVAGFIQPRQVGKVHIVEHPRAREALVVPVDLGVGQYRFHGRLGHGKAHILSDRGWGA